MDAITTAKPRRSKAAKPDQKLLVTIVVSFRERWRFTARTVASILAHSGGDFAIWLLDSGIPPAIRDELKPYIAKGRLELVQVSADKQPNHWRAEIAPRLQSKYAVFIDNDVVVLPGWLDRMVACAEETGAGIVCPLYLWGDSEESDLIHMAGGDLTLEPTPGGTRMTESHRHVSRRIDEVPDDLVRRPCGFGEYHCLMMRREVYSAAGLFDSGIVTVHEHIHATMLARELGFDTWFEPEARVNYLAFVPWQIGELPALRSRWDFAAAESSLEAFARRWKVIDDEDYRAPIRGFLATHAGHTDLLDPRPACAARRGEMMARADLQQTFGGLQWLALDSGYDTKDVDLMVRAYRLALALLDGLYRPCGRPFVNHLAGTASVLLFYGCPMPHVVAALLHASFTHGPPAKTPKKWLDQLAANNLEAVTAVAMVERYGPRARLLDQVDLSGAGMAELPLDSASLFLIDAANEIDMFLSFEVPVTGRSDAMPEARLANCLALLDHVGLPGMAATLRALREEADGPNLAPFHRGFETSFRITPATEGG